MARAPRPRDDLRVTAAELNLDAVGMVEDEARTQLADAVIGEIKRVQETQRANEGFVPRHTLIVDGQRGVTLSAVRAGSTVIIDWDYLEEAVNVVVNRLRAAGPKRGTGNWRKNIRVYVNGQHTTADAIPSGATSAIVLLAAPYSRRLEVGKTKTGRAFAIQTPMHFVEQTVVWLNRHRRYKTLANFEFNYEDISDAHALTPAAQTRRRFAGSIIRHGVSVRKRGRKPEDTVRYPAIHIHEIQAV